MVKEMCDGFRQEVGCGSFGTVYKGILYGTNGPTDIAVKVIRKSTPHVGSCARETFGASTMETFESEANLMWKCRHPNIVPLIACSCDGDLCLVMPLMRDKSLEHLLQDNRRRRLCDANMRIHYAHDIFAGLAYLHARNPAIVHRDIKTQNVLLHGPTARNGDIGIARAIADTEPGSQEDSPATRAYIRTGRFGSSAFIDPEYSDTRRLSTASDIYSSGVVLFMLLSGVNEKDLFKAVSAGRRWEQEQRVKRHTQVRDSTISWSATHSVRHGVFISELLHRKAKACTCPSQQSRPTSEDVLEDLSPYGTTRADPPPERDCMVCMHNRREGLLQPCRHNAVCQECASILLRQHQLCPVCRQPVQTFEPQRLARFCPTFAG
eukprot:gnl/TRDRNA2_/TRDRNA2_200831_c0_seq1.p1 gnl/TRDRNA2_/TRDRNA2_200831_c0~~gnl/TRDRNA2_/TRDRNA2_200831_c0_seq1.p1  ORF type:complete len:379 (-),score=12.52 gnl/TRDRNA2_/TRDRNA2_200831_c0_seq1:188-1324(-)